MNRVHYRDMDSAMLDRQYNARESVDCFASEQALYVHHSKEAMAVLPRIADLNYDPSSDERLDIYGAAPGRPLFIWIHGGYWRGGSRFDNAFAAAGLVERGVAVAIIDYTLAPHVDLLEIVRQSRTAIAWLYQNGAKYDLDVSRIHLGGSSAGGHLAGAILMQDWQNEHSLPENTIGTVLAISGLYDLTPLKYTHINEWMKFTEKQIADLSPISHIPTKSAAHLITSVGGKETQEFHRQTNEFASAWGEAGHSGQTISMPEHNHFNIALSLKDPYSPLVEAVVSSIAKRDL